MNRRKAREQAFCFLFEQAVTGEPAESLLELASQAREMAPAPFAEDELFGVQEHREEIDAMISANIRGWTISRLSKVTLALLRLAIYEMLYDDGIPVSVTINEAVELAKEYGDKDDALYINGVLSTIAKSLAPGEEQA